MQSFREVIELWPDLATLAIDIDSRPDRVRKWKERNSIPADQWQGLIVAAGRRGFSNVNPDTLTRLAARQ